MPSPFSPTPADVERYRRLRATSMTLAHKIVETIPKRAMEEVGDAIGILRGGILLLDSMDMSNVLMDCCLYDWFEDGKNLVQRYAEAHPADPQTDEGYILQASLQASYRLLLFQSAVPGAAFTDGHWAQPERHGRGCCARHAHHPSGRVLDDRWCGFADPLERRRSGYSEPDRARGPALVAYAPVTPKRKEPRWQPRRRRRS